MWYVNGRVRPREPNLRTNELKWQPACYALDRDVSDKIAHRTAIAHAMYGDFRGKV